MCIVHTAKLHTNLCRIPKIVYGVLQEIFDLSVILLESVKMASDTTL